MSKGVFVDHRVFGELRRSSNDRWRVSFGSYNGQDGVDIRVFSRRDRDGKPMASARGILLRPHVLPDLLDLLEQAEEFLIKEGIIKGDERTLCEAGDD